MARKNQATRSSLTAPTRRRANVPVRRELTPAPFARTPFAGMRRFMDDMERLFDNAWGFQFDPFANFNLALPQLAEFEQGMWTPQIETFEQGGKFTLRADLPGMKLEDIDVQITDDALILSGERSEETEEEREGFYHSERNYGSFYRSIPLPQGANTENINATFQNGVLEVKFDVPKRQLKGKKVEIRAADEKPKAKAATHK